MRLLGDEAGLVEFEKFEAWWNFELAQGSGGGEAAQAQAARRARAEMGAEMGDGGKRGRPLSQQEAMEEQSARAQAAIVASLDGLGDDSELSTEEAVAAAVAAAEAAIGDEIAATNPRVFPSTGEGEDGGFDAVEREQDALLLQAMLRREGAAEAAIAAAGLVKKGSGTGAGGGELGTSVATYVQAGVAGLAAAAVAYMAQSSMNS